MIVPAPCSSDTFIQLIRNHSTPVSIITWNTLMPIATSPRNALPRAKNLGKTSRIPVNLRLNSWCKLLCLHPTQCRAIVSHHLFVRFPNIPFLSHDQGAAKSSACLRCICEGDSSPEKVICNLKSTFFDQICRSVPTARVQKPVTKTSLFGWDA